MQQHEIDVHIRAVTRGQRGGYTPPDGKDFLEGEMTHQETYQAARKHVIELADAGYFGSGNALEQ